LETSAVLIENTLSKTLLGRTAETGPQYGAEWCIYPRPSYIGVHDEWRRSRRWAPVKAERSVRRNVV